MRTRQRRTIALGLLVLITGILGGMLLPAFAPPEGSSKHIPASEEDQEFRQRLTLATRLAPAVMVLGLIVIAAGIARRADR